MDNVFHVITLYLKSLTSNPFCPQSHSVGKAHWEGECALSVSDRPAVPAFLAEDVLVQGLEDLSTSS